MKLFDKIKNKAKKFVESIVISITKETREIDIEYDDKMCAPYLVSITNPKTGKQFMYGTLINNSYILKHSIRVSRNKLLMDLLLDHLYKLNDNRFVRDKFSEVFTSEDIKLLIEYFKDNNSFKRAVMEYSS